MSPKTAFKIVGIMIVCVAIFFVVLFIIRRPDLSTENQGDNLDTNAKLKKEQKEPSSSSSEIREDMLEKIEEFKKTKEENDNTAESESENDNNSSDNNVDNIESQVDSESEGVAGSSAETKTEEDIRADMLKKIEEFKKNK